MRRFVDWWRANAELNRRESDEREQFISLLAIRDAFLVVVLASLVVVPLVLVFQGGGAPSLGSVMAMIPLAVMLVAGVTIFLSWARRGGGLSLQTLLFRGIVYGAAFVGAGVLVWAFSRFGLAHSSDIGVVQWITGSVAGVAIAAGLQAFASHRNR